MEIDIDELLGGNRPVSIPTKRAIYMWGYCKFEKMGRNGKEQQLRIPKQLSGAFLGAQRGLIGGGWTMLATDELTTQVLSGKGELKMIPLLDDEQELVLLEIAYQLQLTTMLNQLKSRVRSAIHTEVHSSSTDAEN